MVVDFGGRIGENTRLINNVVVVEIDKKAREWMKKNNVRCLSSLNQLKDNSVDTIYISHVLEHLESPIHYLRLAYKKLKKGGKLIVAVPGEFQLLEPPSPLIDSNGHLHTYNFRNIMTSLDRAGYNIIFWRYNMIILKPLFGVFLSLILKEGFEKYFIAYLKFWRRLNDFRFLRFALFVLHYYFKPLIPLARKLSKEKISFDLEILVIAQKQRD